jgi:protoporphyrinogen/coproporphyrinogen III oxidase
LGSARLIRVPRRVVIVGGGITGLATAHAILAKKPDFDVTVLEQSARPGGKLFTERVDDFVIDCGPDSWVAAKPHATALARAVGLEDDLVETIEANRRVYVASARGLHSLPEGFVLGVPTQIWPILTTPLFSWRAKIRMGLEPFVRRPAATATLEDESIASFVGRRLGREVTERLVAPLLGGIYGGDASTLSVRATLPQFVEAEAKYGSLVLAMRAQKKAAGRGPHAAPASAFVTLRGGIGDLIDRLAGGLGARLRTGASVSSVSRLASDDSRGRFVVDVVGEGPLFAEDVVAAIPADSASRLLRTIDARASEILGAIPHTSTAVVFLAFPEAAIARSLDATGYLVPGRLGSPVMAVTWVSSKWRARAPAGTVFLRVFIGGAGRDEIVARDDDALVRMAKEEVRSRMGIRGEPRLARVYRFLHASPQPLVGHLGRIREVNERLASSPGLYAVGSGYDGVGIPDCVRQAERVAESITNRP